MLHFDIFCFENIETVKYSFVGDISIHLLYLNFEIDVFDCFFTMIWFSFLVLTVKNYCLVN